MPEIEDIAAALEAELGLGPNQIVSGKYGPVDVPDALVAPIKALNPRMREAITDRYADNLMNEILVAANYQGTTAVDWDNPPAVDWLAEGLLPVDASVMLLGRSGIGKSFITVDMVTAIAVGARFADAVDCRKSRVLVYLSEGSAGYVDRFRAAVEAKELDFDDVVANVQIRSNPSLASAQFQAELVQACEEFMPSLVVFDTFSGTSGLVDENNAAAAAGVLAKTKLSIGPATLLIVHHPNKASEKGDKVNARGSGVLYNNMDVVLALYVDNQFAGTASRYLTLTTDPDKGGKVKESESISMRGLYLEKVGPSLVVRHDTGQQSSRANAAVMQVLSDVPMSASAFALAAGISQASAYRYLKDSPFAVKQGKGYVLAEDAVIDDDAVIAEIEGDGA